LLLLLVVRAQLLGWRQQVLLRLLLVPAVLQLAPQLLLLALQQSLALLLLGL
jgi:hypothetical protein